MGSTSGRKVASWSSSNRVPFPSVLVFNGCESGVGVLLRFWVRESGRGGSSRVGRLFSPVDFFVAGVSVTHPVHLTRLQIPNIVWCGVNLLLFSATSFSLLEDPDKKWQIHFCTFFCVVDHDATLGHVAGW